MSVMKIAEEYCVNKTIYCKKTNQEFGITIYVYDFSFVTNAPLNKCLLINTLNLSIFYKKKIYTFQVSYFSEQESFATSV